MRASLTALLLTGLLAGPAGAADPEPLDLQGLLDLALEHDGRVQAAYAKLSAYRAQYDQAAWAWFPKIKLKALVAGPVGSRRLACPDEADCVELVKNGGKTDLGNLSDEMSVAVGGKVEAVLPLYTFGKIGAAKNAARAGVEAGQAQILRARQEVAFEVRRAWYGWLLACSAVEVLTDGEKKVDKTEKKLLEMLDELNENVTERDLFKLRYKASEVRTMLLEAQRRKRMALAAMRFLTGVEDLGSADRPLAEGQLAVPDLQIAERQTYLTRAGEHRPELKLLRAAVRASAAAVEAKRASFYPDLFLLGRFEGSYSPIHDYIDNSLLRRGLTYYTGGLSLGMKVDLDVPQKVFRLEQAEAELHRIEVQAEQATAAVGLELDDRLEKLTTARDTYKILRRGHRAAKAWMRSNQMSYGVGMTNTKDMIESVTAYARSRIEKDKAAHDMLVARDKLDLVVGEDLGKVRSADPR